ncbi:MAG: hypothetical protein APF76_11250 [Desulfitibacter sp. BRH_c19]|nr:MAG: hypothetical protein APF76_11250 [Desulfitibacter sp. BRH_c19]
MEWIKIQLSKSYQEILKGFEKQEGFPKGTLETIISLSEFPQYTACPSPFIFDFIKQHGKVYDEESDNYQRYPFTADVEEGKNEPIYKAHSYHTKVPYKAIMRYILHYTGPGDTVLDCFCGTGMTGVAAQMCEKPEEDFKLQIEQEMGDVSWGNRKALLNDLSPAATFIAYNYNIPVDLKAFQGEAQEVLEAVKKECQWMYETRHIINGYLQMDILGQPVMGWINYTIWSDIFFCRYCGEEIIFWKEAVDKASGKVLAEFPCPFCEQTISKSKMQRVYVDTFDNDLQKTITIAKQIPVRINYSVNGKRFEKEIDDYDLETINKIEEFKIPYSYSTKEIPEGHNTVQPRNSHGITHAHHFYTKRSLYILAAFADKARQKSNRLLWFVTAVTEGSSKLNRERPAGLPSKLNGTLYISSMIREINVLDFLKRKIKKYKTAGNQGQVMLQCTSTTNLNTIPVNSCDYIFTDPPFGANIMYSELNFLWEAWLGVFTDNHPEAIMNKVQGKGLNDYHQLMENCFREMYRVLKPERWLTLVFSNSKNQVWNAIQEALLKTGFKIADVSVLNKKQGSFKQLTTNSAMKEDLVVSAYKPKIPTTVEAKVMDGTEEGVWDFVTKHLENLPSSERQNFMIFDRMVAYHLENGFTIPLGAIDFYKGLEKRFPKINGLYFLPSQLK